jgi:hypothetical protein
MEISKKKVIGSAGLWSRGHDLLDNPLKKNQLLFSI